jgi:predicted nucleic acid-binding protein
MTDNLLIDTNIIIYGLQGFKPVNQLLEQRKISLSFISEIELYSWPNLNERDTHLIKDFIDTCQIIEYSSQLKERVIEVRKKFKLKMADAFIAATALQYDLPLVSADAIFNKVYEINFIKVSI